MSSTPPRDCLYSNMVCFQLGQMPTLFAYVFFLLIFLLYLIRFKCNKIQIICLSVLGTIQPETVSSGYRVLQTNDV